VVGVDPGKSIMLQGWLTSAFGGPAATILEYRLNASGKKTVLQLSDTIFGRVGDEKLSQTREGWLILFEQGLKRHVERKEVRRAEPDSQAPLGSRRLLPDQPRGRVDVEGIGFAATKTIDDDGGHGGVVGTPGDRRHDEIEVLRGAHRFQLLAKR